MARLRIRTEDNGLLAFKSSVLVSDDPEETAKLT